LREQSKRDLPTLDEQHFKLPPKKPVKQPHEDFEALRTIKLLLDNHHINDPDTWQVYIPRHRKVHQFEPKADRKPQEGRVCLCVKHVVDFARQMSGDNSLACVFLITGEEVKTLKVVQDFIRELVVSRTDFLIGIKYGVELKERPATVKKRISFDRRVLRNSSLLTREAIKTTLRRIESSAQPFTARFVRPSPKTEATQRELEELKKEYPIDVLWKVYRFEQEKQAEVGMEYEAIAKKDQEYIDKLEALIAEANANCQDNIKLAKPKHKPVQIKKKRVKSIIFSYQEALKRSSSMNSDNSSVFISGLQSYMEEQELSPRKTISLAKITDSDYGLSPIQYHRHKTEFEELSRPPRSLSPNTRRVAKAAKRLKLTAVLKHHRELRKAPETFKSKLFEVLGIKETLSLDDWVALCALYLYKTASVSYKAAFLAKMMPVDISEVMSAGGSTAQALLMLLRQSAVIDVAGRLDINRLTTALTTETIPVSLVYELLMPPSALGIEVASKVTTINGTRRRV
jgi:hypothetical protein